MTFKCKGFFQPKYVSVLPVMAGNHETLGEGLAAPLPRRPHAATPEPGRALGGPCATGHAATPDPGGPPARDAARGPEGRSSREELPRWGD